MNTRKLHVIAQQAAKYTESLIKDAAEDLESAIAAAVEEAQLDEKEAKLRIGFTHEINMDGNTMTSRLTVSIRKKHEASGELADPNQPELEGMQ